MRSHSYFRRTENTAEQGIPLLRKLVDQATGRIIIMPGCGVNISNICKIAEETGAHEFHLSGRSAIESTMIFRNPRVSMGGNSQSRRIQT